jgi:hypothetical protein
MSIELGDTVLIRHPGTYSYSDPTFTHGTAMLIGEEAILVKVKCRFLFWTFFWEEWYSSKYVSKVKSYC